MFMSSATRRRFVATCWSIDQPGIKDYFDPQLDLSWSHSRDSGISLLFISFQILRLREPTQTLSVSQIYKILMIFFLLGRIPLFSFHPPFSFLLAFYNLHLAHLYSETIHLYFVDTYTSPFNIYIKRLRVKKAGKIWQVHFL